MWYRMATYTTGLLCLVSSVLLDSKGRAINVDRKTKRLGLCLTWNSQLSKHSNQITITKPRHSLSWKMRFHTSDVHVACFIPTGIVLRPIIGRCSSMRTGNPLDGVNEQRTIKKTYKGTFERIKRKIGVLKKPHNERL
jgi:hypothetical protein